LKNNKKTPKTPNNTKTKTNCPLILGLGFGNLSFFILEDE